VFTVPVVDLELPGLVPLKLRRSYSTSSRERDVGLGWGWSHSLAWQVELRRGGAALWTEDGLEVPFGMLEPGAGLLGPHGWLLHTDHDGVVLDTPDGTRRRFSQRGPAHAVPLLKLVSVEDRAKNAILLEYAESTLVRVVDSVGRIGGSVVGAGGKRGKFGVYRKPPGGK
jgi:hypothetical protein